LLDTTPSAPVPAAAGRVSLASLVQGNQATSLLAGIHSAENLDAALALRPGLAAGESVVTREGVWLGPNWVRVARGKNAAAGVLKRKQELAELHSQLESLSARSEQLAALQMTREQELSSLERQRETLSRTIAERQREYAELRSRVSASRMQIEQFAARRTR